MMYISFNGGKKFHIEDKINLNELSRWLKSKTGYKKHKNGKKITYEQVGDPIDFAIIYNETERCMLWTRESGNWTTFSDIEN